MRDSNCIVAFILHFSLFIFIALEFIIIEEYVLIRVLTVVQRIYETYYKLIIYKFINNYETYDSA